MNYIQLLHDLNRLVTQLQLFYAKNRLPSYDGRDELILSLKHKIAGISSMPQVLYPFKILELRSTLKQLIPFKKGCFVLLLNQLLSNCKVKISSKTAIYQ
jgi:hypothetical protein